MHQHPSAEDARSALATVEHGRRRVADEVALPQWYWTGLATGWVVLGVVADSGHAVLGAVATLALGAAHAAVAPRVLSGRRGSDRLQVRADVVPAHLPALVVGFLLLLVALTVAGALLLAADGAQHPTTITSVGVALLLLLGGPRLLAVVRRRAAA